MDKYIVYLIKDNGTSIERIVTDNTQVADILKNMKDVSAIVRSSTNQCAFLLGGEVCWSDIQYRGE
jgi:hypothetical protein